MDNNVVDFQSIEDELGMPNAKPEKVDIHELLHNTDPKHIYLTGDWHFFGQHYKKKNYVNTQDILSWCKNNIKPDDVFMYLGDISFKFANKEHQEESKKLISTVPGIKVLILGNHDMMLGQDYFADCGFDYVYERLDWDNIVFTHVPINMDLMPENYINIHSHMHQYVEYNTTDGKRNINVYPMLFNNKPVTLDYCLKHKEELIKDHKRSDWTQIGESAILEESRADLKDSEFGIPEDRKYPLDSKKHVMSAIKLFGHAEEAKKKALAKRIKTAADKYSISIPETTQVNKYLSESYNKTDSIIPAEVKNIIFDMGSVLVDSDLMTALINNTNIPNEYCEEIYKIIIDLLYNKYGDIEYCELPLAIEHFISIAPEYIRPYATDIFNSFLPSMYKYKYTDSLINAFRINGYKLYYLSNWSKYSYDLTRSFFEPLIKKFDGGLFSYECHMEKPALSIYTLLIDKFNLEPNKCLFFDDKKENIEAAKVCGWHGIIFDKDTTPTKIYEALGCQSTSTFNEWAMAAMNPVIGIHKPFILKACNDCGDILNAKRYALATDLVSDKYLVINEDANLEIVDSSELDNLLVEEYEFIGDIRAIKKIEEAYYSKKTVDNTFFYTALTGKPMLSEDQIDFDPNFKKVDFLSIKENQLTKLATLNSTFMESAGGISTSIIANPNTHVSALLKNKSHLILKEDINGYYIYNTEKNIRSASIEEQNFVTEQMVHSVL